MKRFVTNLIVSVIVIVLTSHTFCHGQAELDGWVNASHSERIAVGETLFISLPLTNVGTVDIPGGAEMNIVISTTHLFADQVGTLCSDSYSGMIRQGETITLECSGTINLTPGVEYWFIAWHSHNDGIWYPYITLEVEPEWGTACCFDDGSCQNMIWSSCTSANGTPLELWDQCLDDFNNDGWDDACPLPSTEACCWSDGHCDDMVPSLCEDFGMIPLGPGTQCSTSDCWLPWACCLPNGSCDDHLLPEPWCTALGGTSHFGKMCSDNPCEPLRACCFVDGTCKDLTQSDCWDEGGTPKSVGVMCSDNPCPEAQACCKPDGDCEMWTEDYCIANGWVPSGPQCLGDNNGDGWDDACETQGACCTSLGECFELEETTCIANGWSWAGAGTQCLGDNDGDGSDDLCPSLGACCDPVTGDCSVLSQQLCLDQNGEWRGPGTQCLGDNNNDGWDDGCGSLPGACCDPFTGDCYVLRQAECISNNWKWIGPGTQCLGDLNQDGFDDTCQEFGACCEPLSGQCFERTRQIDCRELGGIWHGPGTECMGDNNHDGIDDACPGVGKCCDALNNCYVLTQELCNQQPGWTWGGPGTQCLGDIDHDGQDDSCLGYGACCNPVSGACVILKENECIQRRWIWHGEGTQCLGDGDLDGIDDTCKSLGACCDPSGSCWSLTEAVCKMQGLDWTWHGPGTQCVGDIDGDGEDDACGPPQACCFSDGSCEDLLVSDCEEQGGIPQGSGIMCWSNPCDRTGACCDPATGRCLNLTESDCLGRNWNWQGADTQCLGDKDGDGTDDACGLGQDKWTQPPMGIKNLVNTPPFNGWDERSWYKKSAIVADDWLCEDNRPVTGIRWWGSFVGWTNQELPSVKPKAFHIGIWTDIPAGSDFSHPGEMIWEHLCNDWKWEFVGYNDDPRPQQEDDACFLFTLQLPTNNFFYQKGQGSATKYWLSISADYDLDGPQPDYVWGWTTRPDVLNDGAVKIAFPINPQIGSVYKAGNAICSPSCLNKDSGEPWDTAFELTTN